LNVKRLAYEVRPARDARAAAPAAAATAAAPAPLPKAPAAPAVAGVDVSLVRAQADQLLGLGHQPSAAQHVKTSAAVSFVCEEDVRLAIKAGRTILIGERTIVTPAARDLADANRVFVTAGWPVA
jgi:hypothetical protein